MVVRGGHGGKGSASFRREPFVPRGGPDGGDGGRGGSVILTATNELNDLSRYKRRSRWHAEPGADGAGGRKTGRNGADVTLEVPVGTIALDAAGALIADLDRPDARVVVAHGGVGGRGNVHFKSSSRRAPDYAEPGLKGEDRELTLDLKLIADVGLVGPPNAGKSSLLRALTAAHPKVGAYPFTTLDPELGVAEAEGGRIVIADIPGLIEGAAHGAGLGLRFLRHVERTRALVFVLDGSSPEPWNDLETVRHELARFSPDLVKRPYVVAVNKVDLEPVRKLRAKTRKPDVYFVSALTGKGLTELMEAVVKVVAAAPAPSLPDAAKVTKLPVRSSQMVVEKKPSGFVVHGERVERLLERFDLDSEGGLARFQSELDRLGVNEALEAAGVKPGDDVRIAGVEFEYQP
ncbi:MAG: GTPase ObgE [Chloroflexi bacterium]|nr:MAG: GTPase ObgE [Chloroflexota bacterium]TME03844.1 MAG: GTPase ObgE [Chloroflexota bacterium]TME42758.1 MAG: GTPase ObgE [Chloroflexota bacterium]TME53248.1 MAG: GTPase ObgE [Chloroflexota bacterium]